MRKITVSKKGMVRHIIARGYTTAEAVDTVNLVFGHGLEYGDITDEEWRTYLIDNMPTPLKSDYLQGLQILNQRKLRNDIIGEYAVPCEKTAKNDNGAIFKLIAKTRNISLKQAVILKAHLDVIAQGDDKTFKHMLYNMRIVDIMAISTELIEIAPDMTDCVDAEVSGFTYNFFMSEEIPTSGRYAAIKTKEELFKTAKSEREVDYKSFKRHAQLLDEIRDSCEEYTKAIDFIRKNKHDKILMAKAKRKLTNYTYNDEKPPSWITKDRLTGLWNEIKKR